MNILISTVYPSSWPYVDQLAAHLIKSGHSVDILDVEGLHFFKYQKPVSNSKAGKRKLINFISRVLFNRVFLKAQNILSITPLVRKGVQSLEISIIKQLLKKRQADYDILNIHYLLPVYTNTRLLRHFDTIATKSIISVWGSDFYRTDEESRKRLSVVFDWTDAINCSEKALKDITGYYKNYREKAFDLLLGIDSLDMIRDIKRTESVVDLRKKFKIPPEAIVITIGYNSNTHQQHIKIIEALKEINRSFKGKLFFILPMTYANNQQNYREKVESLLKQNSFDFILLKDFMSIEDICRLRIVTDIAVNMQITDMMSSSIREHLYCGNVVITGKWLPYEIYDRIGVISFRIEFEEIHDTVQHAISNLESIKQKCLANAEKVYNIAAWPVVINKWIGLYKKVLDVDQ